MGLFDMFKKKAEPAAAAAPSSISASAGADVLCSPVKGKVIKMADVPDPVFGGEVLGKGCAVWPEDDLVYAPCDGKVTVTMGHAVGLQSDSGISKDIGPNNCPNRIPKSDSRRFRVSHLRNI